MGISLQCSTLFLLTLEMSTYYKDPIRVSPRCDHHYLPSTTACRLRAVVAFPLLLIPTLSYPILSYPILKSSINTLSLPPFPFFPYQFAIYLSFPSYPVTDSTPCTSFFHFLISSHPPPLSPFLLLPSIPALDPRTPPPLLTRLFLPPRNTERIRREGVEARDASASFLVFGFFPLLGFIVVGVGGSEEIGSVLQLLNPLRAAAVEAVEQEQEQEEE